MVFDTYNFSDDALSATDKFYDEDEGFQYDEEKATEWVRNNIKIPKQGRVLDLCCGDGIWSKAFQNINSSLEIYGVDISAGGINKAIRLLDTDQHHFVVCDAEKEIPFEDGYFDLIFARGPGLYNQHSMDREATIEVISRWHRLLVSPSSRFYSIFASTPKLMGSYTPMDKCKLPYNRAPRKTDSVDFSGGKYHHTIESFHAPFWRAGNARIVDYKFMNNLHFLVTTLDPA